MSSKKLKEALDYSRASGNIIANPLVAIQMRKATQEAMQKAEPFKGSALRLNVKTPPKPVVTLRKEVLPQDFIPEGTYGKKAVSGSSSIHRRSTKHVPEYKTGGKVKKTGVVKLHKGEVVVPANRVKAVDSALKKSGLKPLKK